MTATEIRDLAVASASEYYDYLTETNRGVQTLGVVSIENGKEQLIKLLLCGKLLNTETLYFEILTTGTRYSDPEIITYYRFPNTTLQAAVPKISDRNRQEYPRHSNARNRDRFRASA